MPMIKRKRTWSTKTQGKRWKRNVDTIARAPSIRSKYTHKFQRSVGLTFLATSASVPTFAQLIFRLADLPNYTEFTALFDQYKIDKVEVNFVPNISQNSANDIPIVYTVVDFDDGNTPANLDVLRQYETAILHADPRRPFKRTLVPRVATAAYSGGFSGYANQTSWIDVASASVEHYGVKAGASAASQTITLFVECKYWVSFRNAR